MNFWAIVIIAGILLITAKLCLHETDDATGFWIGVFLGLVICVLVPLAILAKGC